MRSDFFKIILIVECRSTLAGNEQGFAMLGVLENVKPETAADSKINLQDNN